jgi:ABC-type polar amino acid transport system ATPase subunit
MLRCINGLETIDEGTITVDGSASTPPGAGSRRCAARSGWSSSRSTCSRT